MWVIIPAGGTGSRFSNERPKQYWQIQDLTILEHSAEVFLSSGLFKEIVIAVPENDIHYAQLPIAKNPQVSKVPAGDIRMKTVLNALAYLQAKAKPDDWVLIHDAVRPCLHHDDLLTLIDTLQNEEVGGILASPVQDTVKYIHSNKEITHTVDRTPLWSALTPQMFRFKLIQDALRHCDSLNIQVTDDASAIEHFGFKPKVVMAMHPNPKLTYSKDLRFIAHLLSPCEVES